MPRNKDTRTTNTRPNDMFCDLNPPGPFSDLVTGDITVEVPNGIAHSRAESDAIKDLGNRADEGFFILKAMRKQPWRGNRSGE